MKKFLKRLSKNHFLRKTALQLLFAIPVLLITQELASIYLVLGVVFVMKWSAYIGTIILVGELYERRRKRKALNLEQK